MTKTSAPAKQAKWIFDPLPASGARRGGDSAGHVFRHDLETFVREVIQNANDQRVGFPAVCFRPVHLAGNDTVRFMHALDWPTLLPHLRAVAQAHPDSRVSEFLHGVEHGRQLSLLVVEDRNTVGLTGDEHRGDSHFRALCKDTLYSHKPSEVAGGSYGLGKSVLWTFSGASIVLFCSVLAEDPEGHDSPRLIGRCELPSHRARVGRRDRWFTGSGWFGMPSGSEARRRAESLWGAAAHGLAERLGLARDDRSGTSMLVVGFSEPAREGDDPEQQLAERIAACARRYFWPAMAMQARRLRVSVGLSGDERVVSTDRDNAIAPFIECYARRAETGPLLKPGDVARRTIELTLPPPRESETAAFEVSGEVDLIVRLADARVRSPLIGRVALFRGPGMVVRYWERASLAAGMLPFHAVLVCGEARDPKHPSPGDRAVERFLRAAEPPGHGDWRSTPALRQRYRRGYAQALKQLKDDVGEALRELLTPRAPSHSEGPERLRRRFPLGGTEGMVDRPFRFVRLSASFDGERWVFDGELEPERKRLPWLAELTLDELGEDGAPVAAVKIAELKVHGERARCELTPQAARIAGPAEIERVAFSGKSARRPAIGVGELAVSVSGVIGAGPDAPGESR